MIGYLFSRPIPADELPAKIAELGWTGNEWRREQPVAPDLLRELPRETRRRIVTMHRQGASPHTIAAALNQLGIKSPQGARWHPVRVARIIAAEKHGSAKAPAFGRPARFTRRATRPSRCPNRAGTIRAVVVARGAAPPGQGDEKPPVDDPGARVAPRRRARLR